MMGIRGAYIDFRLHLARLPVPARMHVGLANGLAGRASFRRASVLAGGNDNAGAEIDCPELLNFAIENFSELFLYISSGKINIRIHRDITGEMWFGVG